MCVWGGGAEKVLAILKWGDNKFWGSFHMVAFSHIEGGEAQSFQSLKGRAQTVLPCLEEGWGGGCATSFVPAIFPFCSPPP